MNSINSIKRIERKLIRIIESEMENKGFVISFSGIDVLSAMLDLKGRARNKNIVKATNMTKGSVSLTVNRLKSFGYIDVAEHGIRVLTEKGYSALKAYNEISEKIHLNINEEELISDIKALEKEFPDR